MRGDFRGRREQNAFYAQRNAALLCFRLFQTYAVMSVRLTQPENILIYFDLCTVQLVQFIIQTNK